MHANPVHTDLTWIKMTFNLAYHVMMPTSLLLLAYASLLSGIILKNKQDENYGVSNKKKKKKKGET